MRQTEMLSTRPETSDEAFAAVPSGAAAEVLEAIRECPRTVDQLMADLNMGHATCSARVNQLMRDGWVFDSGMRSATRSGRTAIVWQASTRPRPIGRTAATRSELMRRIKDAAEAIDRGDIESARRALEVARG